MNEFVGQAPDYREKIGPYPILRDVLANSSFKPGRYIAPELDGIDLGVFGEEARLLANECFMDPDNCNTGKMVYVTGSKKVLVPKSFFQGIPKGPLGMISSVSGEDKHEAEQKQAESRFLAMAMHTQADTDLPFSPTGLLILAVEDTHRLSTTSIFVVGKTKNMLMFRGETAPQWSEEESTRKVKLWDWQLHEAIRKFLKPGMDLEARQDIITRANGALINRICQTYDLHFFVGDTSSPIVTRQTP